MSYQGRSTSSCAWQEFIFLKYIHIFIHFYRGYSIDVIIQRPVSSLEEILENSECA